MTQENSSKHCMPDVALLEKIHMKEIRESVCNKMKSFFDMKELQTETIYERAIREHKDTCPCCGRRGYSYIKEKRERMFKNGNE